MRAGWLVSAPELLVAAGLVLVSSAAVYLYAGLGAAVLAVIAWAVVLIALLRTLIPVTDPPREHEAPYSGAPSSFTGFWRKRGLLSDATASLAAYDNELRPTLQNLLAARLADRHGVSLYHDPATARRLLLPGDGHDDLWYWVDPERPAQTTQGARGIPARSLALIIERLERL
jgi:hypothetical protein